MIFIWFFTVYERWACDIHKWFIHFLHEGMGGTWRWISCWFCRLVFATIHDIFKWYAGLGIKTARWPYCLPRLPYRTHFFTVSCIKDFFCFQRQQTTWVHPLACKSRIGNKDDAPTRDRQDIVRDDIAILSGSYWERGEDLNLWPSGYEPDELPGCSTPH